VYTNYFHDTENRITAAEMKFMRRMADYIRLDYKKNLEITNSQKTVDLTARTTFFECPAQESRSKFLVANKRDQDVWEIPSNASPRK
jgi:hypothetical protein